MSDLEQLAIERIKLASEMSFSYYKKPLILVYSGGKDSDVSLELFKRSGVPFEVSHSHTTADAPETVYHVRETFKKLEEQFIKTTVDYHVNPDGTRTTMWNLIPQKFYPPTRRVRYCCSNLKEQNIYTRNRMIATGVRWAESKKRQNRDVYEVPGKSIKDVIGISDEKMLLSDQDEETRMLFERCQLKAETIVNPIIDWEDEDIWDYTESENICLCSVYEKGLYRCGCVGCCMSSAKQMLKEFALYPQFRKMYIATFDRMLRERESRQR